MSKLDSQFKTTITEVGISVVRKPTDKSVGRVSVYLPGGAVFTGFVTKSTQEEGGLWVGLTTRTAVSKTERKAGKKGFLKATAGQKISDIVVLAINAIWYGTKEDTFVFDWSSGKLKCTYHASTARSEMEVDLGDLEVEESKDLSDYVEEDSLENEAELLG